MVKYENISAHLNSSNESDVDQLHKATMAQQVAALRIELNTLAFIQQLNERPHPNIIRLIGATTTRDNEFYLMTEYCEYGSLDRYLQEKHKNNLYINEIVDGNLNAAKASAADCSLRRNNFVTTRDLLAFAEQIASAMEYISKKNVSGLYFSALAQQLKLYLFV